MVSCYQVWSHKLPCDLGSSRTAGGAGVSGSTGISSNDDDPTRRTSVRTAIIAHSGNMYFLFFIFFLLYFLHRGLIYHFTAVYHIYTATGGTVDTAAAEVVYIGGICLGGTALLHTVYAGSGIILARNNNVYTGKG